MISQILHRVDGSAIEGFKETLETAIVSSVYTLDLLIQLFLRHLQIFCISSVFVLILSTWSTLNHRQPLGMFCCRQILNYLSELSHHWKGILDAVRAMNQSKKSKLSDEDEDFFLKLPNEILAKIISFVPSKKSCFLVNKRFHQESIRATRNKCWLDMKYRNVNYLTAVSMIWNFSYFSSCPPALRTFNGNSVKSNGKATTISSSQFSFRPKISS